MLSASSVRTARLKKYGKFIITGAEQRTGLEPATSAGPTPLATVSEDPT